LSADLAPLIGAIGGIIVLLFFVTVTVLVIIIIVLCKAKARLSKQLLDQHGKDAIDVENKIYEELDQMPHGQLKVDTENNVAYASCRSIMRSASCACQSNNIDSNDNS
jgi:hypothetical protein